jgi:serine/threonine-protein kinase RIO1
MWHIKDDTITISLRMYLIKAVIHVAQDEIHGCISTGKEANAQFLHVAE